MSINKSAAYLVINSHEFNTRSKIIWDIDWRIVYKSLYDTLDECCSKCHTILRTCRVDINSYSQFLFIINKQNARFNDAEKKTFTIYRKIEIPINNFESDKLQNKMNRLDVIVYELKSVIFLDDEGHYSWILKFKVNIEEEWFKYRGDNDNVYLISETYEPDFVHIYSWIWQFITMAIYLPIWITILICILINKGYLKFYLFSINNVNIIIRIKSIDILYLNNV